MRPFIVLTLAWFLLVVILSACGLLNSALGGSGYAPQANTPEAREKAVAADRATTDWLYWILFGTGAVAAGAAGKTVHSRRRAARTAKTC